MHVKPANSPLGPLAGFMGRYACYVRASTRNTRNTRDVRVCTRNTCVHACNVCVHAHHVCMCMHARYVRARTLHAHARHTNNNMLGVRMCGRLKAQWPITPLLAG